MAGEGKPALSVDRARGRRNLDFIRRRSKRLAKPLPRLAPFGVPAGALLAAGLLLVIVTSLVLDAASVSWALDLGHPALRFFRFITRYGKSDWLLYPSGILCIVLFFADWRAMERRIAAAWFEVGAIAAFLFASVAGAGIATNIVKQIIGRARPEQFALEGPYSLVPFTFDYSHQGFPSGHATTMGAVFMVVAVVAPRYRALVAVPCALILLSRVAVGAHYPSDVVAGFLFGAAFALGVARWLARRGFGFSAGPWGTITARAPAIGWVFRRGGGLGTMNSELIAAIDGRGDRPV
jgi:undecaprenyl-diphosphatase